jgi:hypothetical protein
MSRFELRIARPAPDLVVVEQVVDGAGDAVRGSSQPLLLHLGERPREHLLEQRVL